MVDRDSSPEARARMIGASFEGDEALVRDLLKTDPTLANLRDEVLGTTPLHVSAHRGYLGIVQALLASGAHVDAREGCSATSALHWAAEAGHPRVAEALLEAGAALDPRDAWHDQTPLDWALFVIHAPQRHADRAAVAALLEARGAQPSIFAAVAAARAEDVRASVARDAGALDARLGPVDGEVPPLVFAAERGAVAMVELLLELGADPDALGERGMSARALAWLARDDATLALLDGRGAAEDLSYHAFAGHARALRAALARDEGLLRPGGTHGGLLHAAVLLGEADATRLLLEAGADANARLTCLGVDEWLCELPPLFLAASRGCATCAAHLVDHGADVNARGMRSGATALHVAALRGHRGVLKLLLERGADPRARDERRSSTPAGWARDAGHAELAELLANGASATHS